jgi:hypothetical protein
MLKTERIMMVDFTSTQNQAKYLPAQSVKERHGPRSLQPDLPAHRLCSPMMG